MSRYGGHNGALCTWETCTVIKVVTGVAQSDRSQRTRKTKRVSRTVERVLSTFNHMSCHHELRPEPRVAIPDHYLPHFMLVTILVSLHPSR